MTTPTQQHSYVNIPETVSKKAQEFLRTLRDPALMPAFPDAGDLAGWKKVQAAAEAAGTATSAPRLKRYEHTVRETSLGGVPGGLKEVLLSGFVRMYQALDTAGVTVKLDLYEGMIHNFPDRIPDAPEAIAARQKMRAFLHQHLGL